MVGWGAALHALALFLPPLRSYHLPRGGVGGVFLLVWCWCLSVLVPSARAAPPAAAAAAVGGGGLGWLRVRLGRWSRRWG